MILLCALYVGYSDMNSGVRPSLAGRSTTGRGCCHNTGASGKEYMHEIGYLCSSGMHACHLFVVLLWDICYNIQSVCIEN